MSDWHRCIITYIDFPRVKTLAASGKASRLMCQIYEFVAGNAKAMLPSHVGVYVWNDSILLVAYMAKAKDKEIILREQSAFKAAIDEHVPTRNCPYAIVVQGKTFPIPNDIVKRGASPDPLVVPLKSSSWAMANCFHIEQTLGHRNATWYIDSRITAGVKLLNKQNVKRVALFPPGEKRGIVMIDDHKLQFS